jgi:hypothetical protein
MTSSRDTDRMLDRWMDEGPRAVADRVIAGAMTEIQTTRQLSARWAALKEIFMTLKPAAVALGLAAVVVVGIATYRSISDQGNGAGPDPAESPRIVTASEVPEASSAPDVGDIVVTNENAPEGWTVDATLRGREVLTLLIRYGDVSSSSAGFIDARATDFCADGQGCGTSWVAVYESTSEAAAAYSQVRAEMQVGWGMGIYGYSLGFEEDEGSAYRNNLGNAAATHAYLWRTGPLVLGVIALDEMASDALRPIAEEMNARIP